MRIGEKVVVKINNTNSTAALLNGLTGTIIDEKISDSQMAMLSGVSSWIVQFDKPANILGSQLTTCTLRENELECLDNYEVVAYDKDSDMEVSLHKTNDYDDAKAHAIKFGEQCRLDLLLNPTNGQPFDWVELVNADNRDVVYWASYNR
jgi:hypothetical protein